MITNGRETMVPAADVDALADLPVRVDVSAGWRDELVAWLEGDLRWQVVGGGGALRAEVLISDDPADRSATVVVTDTGRVPDASGGPPVLRWPHERAQLLPAVLRAVRPPTVGDATGRGCAVLGVGGTSGGVGVSTVALALGGLAAWRGARTLVAGGDDLLELCGTAPWHGPGLTEVAALSPADAGREILTVAHRLQGIDRLLVIGGADRPLATGGPPWPLDLLVVDLRGRWDTADVVVAAAGRRAPAPVRGALLVREADGLSRQEAAGLLGRTPTGWLADDPRVRRAGAAGRLPTGLPGRWLADLDRTMRAVQRVAA